MLSKSEPFQILSKVVQSIWIGNMHIVLAKILSLSFPLQSCPGSSSCVMGQWSRCS